MEGTKEKQRSNEIKIYKDAIRDTGKQREIEEKTEIQRYNRRKRKRKRYITTTRNKRKRKKYREATRYRLRCREVIR